MKLHITTLTTIFISFGASANLEFCNDLERNAKYIYDLYLKHEDVKTLVKEGKIRKDKKFFTQDIDFNRELSEYYLKQASQISNVYNAFCKEK